MLPDGQDNPDESVYGFRVQSKMSAASKLKVNIIFVDLDNWIFRNCNMRDNSKENPSMEQITDLNLWTFDRDFL